MSKVLVTGADGFIGSHLVEALVASGHEVRAFVLYNSFNLWGWLDRVPAAVRDAIEVVTGDIRDQAAVTGAVRDCAKVFHLAALIAIPYSYRAPESYVDTNIKGTLHVLQAARAHNVARVIHTSTSEVYGSARYVPIDEEHPLQGQSPYAATKIAADQMALSFFRSFGTPVTVLRPFNTYGPRQSARAVIPTVILQIIAGRRSLQLGNLSPTRDFSFVADTVRGFLAVAECDAAVGQVVNTGSGVEVSINDTAKMIAQLMHADLEIDTDPDRMRPEGSEVDRLVADTARAKALMNWQPTFDGLDGLRRGLAETIRWFDDPANRAAYKPDIYNR